MRKWMSSMHMETREVLGPFVGGMVMPLDPGGAVPLSPLLNFCKFGLNFDQKVGSTGDCLLSKFLLQSLTYEYSLKRSWK
ncbi:hypothetical protein V6N13_036607 [Hibiscus sabdariffa]